MGTSPVLEPVKSGATGEGGVPEDSMLPLVPLLQPGVGAAADSMSAPGQEHASAPGLCACVHQSASTCCRQTATIGDKAVLCCW